MSILNINSSIAAFEQDANGSIYNPTKKVDWAVKINGITVNQPDKIGPKKLDPEESVTIFSGQRTLTIDGTTEFTLTLNPLYSCGCAYRLTKVAGTAAGFRTDRGLALNGEAVGLTINNNAVVDMNLVSTSPGSFASVLVGDIIFIPGVSTGDSPGAFTTVNEGFWKVLAKGPVNAVPNKKLSLKRLDSQQNFAAENTTLTANSQLQAFSSSGVQVGDIVNISAGFSSASFNNYSIAAVTPNFIEFISSNYLPLESNIIPGASGITIYSDAKRYIHFEADQKCLVSFNNDTSGTMIVEPLGTFGFLDKTGITWKMEVTNKSTSVANIIVISAE